MRNFRRLPPLVRIARPLGGLFVLISLVLLGWMLVTRLPDHLSLGMFRLVNIAVSLSALGSALNLYAINYGRRFRTTGVEDFPLSSWQNQARTIALLAALPICALALALFVPSSSPIVLFTGLVNVFACVVIILTILRWSVYGVVP
jgi:hypothetical protein